MGYSITAPSYVEQPEQLIYQKLFSGSPTMDLVKNKQTGIKSAETINVVNTRGVFQAQSCAFNASGSTTISQRTITVGKTKIDMLWCERDLEPYFTQKKLAAGGDYDSLAYSKEIIDDTMQQAKEDIEIALWQGDTNSTNAYLNRFDGFVKIIGAATIGGTFSGVAWSEANSRTAIKGLATLVIANNDVYQGNPTVKMLMSPQMAATYRFKLRTDNLFNTTGEETKLYAEGANIEIVEVAGLSGLNYIYAIEPENMYIGTDMANEEEKFKVWKSDDDQNLKFHAEWKLGVQIAFPSRVYKYLGV
jgi:hypothetical protein